MMATGISGPNAAMLATNALRLRRGSRKAKKPPPRRKKNIEDASPRELLWAILQEERRVVIEGVPRWMRTSEIIIRKAFQLADAGKPTLQRLLSELLFSVDMNPDGKGEGPRVVIDPDGMFTHVSS